MVAMADLEKHRNGLYVVYRTERERPFTFEPAPQLNVNSRKLVGWSIGWIPLACSISGSYIEPTCDTKHESKHTP
jgi:hypothetical protein